MRHASASSVPAGALPSSSLLLPPHLPRPPPQYRIPLLIPYPLLTSLPPPPLSPPPFPVPAILPPPMPLPAPVPLPTLLTPRRPHLNPADGDAASHPAHNPDARRKIHTHPSAHTIPPPSPEPQTAPTPHGDAKSQQMPPPVAAQSAPGYPQIGAPQMTNAPLHITDIQAPSSHSLLCNLPPYHIMLCNGKPRSPPKFPEKFPAKTRPEMSAR